MPAAWRARDFFYCLPACAYFYYCTLGLQLRISQRRLSCWYLVYVPASICHYSAAEGGADYKATLGSPKPPVWLARSLMVCARAQYHGQRRIRDVSRLASEFDIVVATYQTLGADHRMARPLPLCCSKSSNEFASVFCTYQDPAPRNDHRGIPLRALAVGVLPGVPGIVIATYRTVGANHHKARRRCI